MKKVSQDSEHLKPGIIKYGTVRIDPKGKIFIEDFVFHKIKLHDATRLVLRWALNKIKEAGE